MCSHVCCIQTVCMDGTFQRKNVILVSICQAALCLLSARRGAKYMEPAIKDTLSFITAFMQLYADI